jgi:hypothetical protein
MEVQPVRFGSFFFFIGFILLIIFFATTQGPEPQVGLFFIGTFLVAIGFIILWKNWRRPSKADRFRMLRKMHRISPEEQAGDPRMGAPRMSKEEAKKNREQR